MTKLIVTIRNFANVPKHTQKKKSGSKTRTYPENIGHMIVYSFSTWGSSVSIVTSLQGGQVRNHNRFLAEAWVILSITISRLDLRPTQPPAQ